MITRLNISKLGGARYDLVDGDERIDRKLKVYNTAKLLLATNQKHFVVALGPSLTFLQEHTLRKSFKKREKTRRNNDIDNEDSFRVVKKMDVPFEILDVSFSQTAPHYLCVLGSNQINIFNTSSNSNRDFKKLVYKFQNESDAAVKFSWIPF